MINEISEYLEKQSGMNDRKLKYDFMPPLLEITEKPANKWGSIIIIGIFTLIVACVIWAVCCPLDIVITAHGSVIPEGDLKIVHTYKSGVISEINVKSGDYVQKGDVIAKLSQEESDINITALESKIALLKAEQEVQEQLYNGTDVSNIDATKYPDYTYQIESILKTEKLYQLQAKEASTENKELLQTKRDQELLNNIGDCIAQINEDEEQLAQAKLNNEYSNICATKTGYINELKINTIGESVSSFGEIATIVPENATMVFQCYINTKDIADIAVGQEVELKLDAYSYSKYGVIKGTVKNISPSSSYLEKLGQVYTATVEIHNDNKKVDIISGLNGTAEVKIGDRSVFQYLMEPITKGLDNSLKEK